MSIQLQAESTSPHCLQASTNQSAAAAQPHPLQANSQPQAQTSSQPATLSALAAASGGSRQLKELLSWQKGAKQQEPGPASDPGVPGANAGEAGADFNASGADTTGTIPSRPRDKSRGLGVKSEALGAKAVAPGAKSGSGQEGDAQGSSSVQHLHGTLGHQAASGIVPCIVHL